jgi:hypothetical protein
MSENLQKYYLSLLNTDSSRAIADIICEHVGNSQKNFDILFDFCFSHSYPVSMRAARAMQFCVERYPELMNPYLDQMVELTLSAKIEGVKRGFLKILSENIDPTGINNSGLLVDKCVDWALSKNEKPAIRYYSIDILLKISKKEPSLKNEILSVFEILLDDSSPSVRSKVQRALRSI